MNTRKQDLFSIAIVVLILTSAFIFLPASADVPHDEPLQGAFYYIPLGIADIPNDIAQFASWGFDCITLVIFPESLTPNEWLVWNMEYVSRIDAVIEACNEEGISVIMDYHQYAFSSYWNNLDHYAYGLPQYLFDGYGTSAAEKDAAWLDVWTTKHMRNGHNFWNFVKCSWDFLVLRYRDEPCIVYWDLFNEPRRPTGISNHTFNTKLREFYEYLLDAHRRRARCDDDTIMVQMRDATYDSYFQPPQRENIILGAHEYAVTWIDGWITIQLYVNYAITAGIQVHFNEFGALFHDDLALSAQLAGYINDRIISDPDTVKGWNYWAYNNDKPSALIRNPTMVNLLQAKLLD
jgi:hypothetical protein